MTPALHNVIVVYHLDSMQPRMLATDVSNPNDPAWHNINGEPHAHAMMHIRPDEYNGMDYVALQTHHAKYIPIHRSWYQKIGHKYKGHQGLSAQEFNKHLSSITI